MLKYHIHFFNDMILFDNLRHVIQRFLWQQQVYSLREERELYSSLKTLAGFS